MISLLMADCPWRFRDRLPGKGRGAAKHYACMSVDELCSLRLPTEGDRDSVLFFWRVASMQEEALRVIKAWRYSVRSELVWQKTTRTGKPHFGMGHYVRASHETCLIAVRGSALPAVHDQRSTFSAPVGVHSAKPDEAFRIAERMYPRATYYELFARRIRRGWIQSGNELGKLGETA